MKPQKKKHFIDELLYLMLTMFCILDRFDYPDNRPTAELEELVDVRSLPILPSLMDVENEAVVTERFGFPLTHRHIDIDEPVTFTNAAGDTLEIPRPLSMPTSDVYPRLDLPFTFPFRVPVKTRRIGRDNNPPNYHDDFYVMKASSECTLI